MRPRPTRGAGPEREGGRGAREDAGGETGAHVRGRPLSLCPVALTQRESGGRSRRIGKVYRKGVLQASTLSEGFPGGSEGKESACNAGDPGLIPGSGRGPGGGHTNPLHDYCLERPMGRGAWWATVHGVAKSQTRLSG